LTLAEVIGLVAHQHPDTSCRMRLSILGHVEASVDDRVLPLGGAKQRAVLAMLSLEANRVVTADRLIEGLWGEQPPLSAPKMVQNYVWRLRSVLNGESGAQIVTRGRGYELQIDREQVDVCRLERLVSTAARAAETGQPTNGAAREALALFRGDPLADVADEPFAIAEIRRLEELRLTAAELAIDADLAAGRHQEMIGEIDALLAQNPLRERLHGQRMLALYRCGRQAEALEAYRDARRALVEEIGVEPTPELRGLHDAILRQDPSLDVEPAACELPPELDATASPPLIGREDAVRRLRERWRQGGALVTVIGASGMGKTRIAAELAADAHREGAMVLYASGTGPSEAALAAVERMRKTRRPALLVLDDADRATADVRAALRGLAPLGLVLATGQEAAALARLEPEDSIVLEPLGADSVSVIAGLYGDAPPVETLLATSRGVARRVHDAASEWARREATRRVDIAADRAAGGRSEVAAREAELAGSVVQLQTARERSWDRRDSHTPLVCPYKGLATFEPDDAEYFFGRERLVADLVARLVGTPLLAVVGPSGSGKSSAVRAGLLPALAGGVLPGSEKWTQALMRPGEHPLRELRRTTRRLGREWRSVLVVDQFEELFTVCEDEQERAEFVAELVRVAGERSAVVLAVRADFYGRCAAYPELSRRLGANNVLVGPMAREELRRAIERPAERAGLSVEPELVEALLADVESQPGALPLLSTALLELWLERDERRLRFTAYARSGGVQGAVARLAEDAFVVLDPSQQAAARKLLLRLTDESEGGAIVRRRIGLDELEPAAAEVAARLTDRRLLTISEGTVEVAHEALLREWPRLRTWLDEDVQGRRLHRQLSDAARAWDADARDAGGLYRGARLASALEWASDHEPELNAIERAFLDHSHIAHERANRRLRLVIAGMACLLGLALGAGALALNERRNALDESVAGAAQRLDANALLDAELDRSLLLARQAVAMDDSVQTRGNLLAALLKSPATIGVLRGNGDRPLGLELSPDQRTLAVLDADGTLTFVDTRTRRAVGPSYPALGHEYHDGEFDDLRFSPDGTRVAVGGDAPAIVDARSHRLLVGLRNRKDRTVYSVRFSPDGLTVVALIGPSENAVGSGKWIQRFDAASGRALGSEQSVGRRAGFVNLMVTSDGRRLVTSSAEGTAIWDATTLRPLRHLPVPAGRAALSPDDRTMLVAGRDRSVRFLDLETGELGPPAGRHDAAVADAAFTHDGRRAVTAGADGRAIVWDVQRATATETLAGHTGKITALAVAPQGSTLYTAALDGSVFAWDLAGTRRLGSPFAIPASPLMGPLAAVSPDGRSLVVEHRDGTIGVIDIGTLRTRSKPFRVSVDGRVSRMRFLPDGRLAIGSSKGELALVDPRRPEGVMRLPSQPTAIWAMAISADQSAMATLTAGGTTQLWTLPEGRAAGRPFLFRGGAVDVSLSPDGRTLAATGYRGNVEIIDVATRRGVRSLRRDSDYSSAQFTPDGRFLVTVGGEGWVRLWSTESWRPTSDTFGAQTGEVFAATVSPDSSTVATGSMDGTVRLWDIGTGQPIGIPLPGLPNEPVIPEFTPDGAYLLAVSDTGRAVRWDVRSSSWTRHACQVAARTLTRAEWDDVLPDHEYAPACSG
jgi:WD40 repeat protein/DNA-binding SARP family transcriptional activator